MNRVIFLFLVLIIGQSCKNNEDVSSHDILGYWTVSSATRNGDFTKTLDKARFIIEEELFSSDMTGEEISQTYTIDRGVITTQDKIMYSVKRIENDTMELAFTIRNVDFDVTLMRRVDTE